MNRYIENCLGQWRDELTKISKVGGEGWDHRDCTTLKEVKDHNHSGGLRFM